jgi:large subunit ribosomal protein L30
MAKLKITQVRSVINCTEKQKRTMQALGLGRPNSTVIQQNNVSTKGMIGVVQHLVKVEEISE